MPHASPRSPYLNIPAEAILFSLFLFRRKPGQKEILLHPLKVKAVAHLPVNLARVIIVKTSKREAVVKKGARVGNIGRFHGNREILANLLTYRQVRPHVAR